MEYLKEYKRVIEHIEITCDLGGKYESYSKGYSDILEILFKAKKDHIATYICGNGGSAAIAQHMTADYLKNGGMKVISLYNAATMSCIANDLNFDYVFSKQLELYAGEGELLIAISSSGESVNIIKAIKKMKSLGGRVITLTGFKSQNRIRSLGDYNIYVPAEHYGMVESIHTMILQQFVDSIVERDGVALSILEDESND